MNHETGERGCQPADEWCSEMSMRPVCSSQPALPLAWAHVLDNVEATLRSTEAAAAEREQAIGHASPYSDDEKERVAQWQQSLERLEEHMEGWSTVLQQADKEASEADVVLNAGEAALRRWLSDAAALERRLAKWVKPEV